MKEMFDWTAIAYKKLKASIFFNKTQLPLRDKIVLFEDSKNIDDQLRTLSSTLDSGEGWDSYEKEILDSIKVLTYPKALRKDESDTAIFNGENAPIVMDAPQYFIDMSVEGHILSVLWVLTVGKELDKNSDEKNQNGMYEHSYGNRLRNNLINEKTNEPTFSPGLFQPYFSQYESWRDYGLEKAKERLKDEQDALILTLDFKSFFYSVDIQRSDFDGFIERIKPKKPWHDRVNDFVFKVIEKYSEKLRQTAHREAELQLVTRNVLPIGFLPSNILSNWVLTAFDNAIIEKWNPVYYGRYVDDIIIVDKVEKNSHIYKMARDESGKGRLTSADVIKDFLVKPKILSHTKILSYAEKKPTYIKGFKISDMILGNPNNDIKVQDGKVKLFYFQSGSTQALLQCFQTQIAQNKSEFRMMPNLDSILEYRNYSEIFDLKNKDGINKFRGITGIELDKFALSKFLGKYRKVSGMIDGKEENVFEQDLMLIMDERTLIANYNAWERLFEILIVNNRLKLFEDLTVRILNAISRYQAKEKVCADSVDIHEGLVRVLYSSMCRTLALSWGEDVDGAIIRIFEKVKDILSKTSIDQKLINNFSKDDLYAQRRAYCTTRMVNKYILPIPIDCVMPTITSLQPPEIHLFSLNDMRKHLSDKWSEVPIDGGYRYHPYMVTPHDLSFALTCTDIGKLKRIVDPHMQQEKVKRLFITWNYPTSDPDERDTYQLKESNTTPMGKVKDKELFATHVEIQPTQKGKITVAIGNARLSEADFDGALDKRPNRSYKRYKDFAEIFDAAIKAKVELLILPENYLPFEWLPTVVRLCASNQMALVTGVEHIIAPTERPDKRGCVYNLTATILPYKYDDYPFAHISYHNKVEYSPGEKEKIEGLDYERVDGNSYQLFCWKDVWFPVYCCYELASIQDRALFQSYADMVIAVEWNRDVPYFSNIVESLTRDLHCYCIQANSSDFGDSRVISPTKTEIKDIIKTKGGRNNCILVDTLDVKALRDFQRLGNVLQNKEDAFKNTPPGFDKEILELKRDGKLMDYLIQTYKKGRERHA